LNLLKSTNLNITSIPGEIERDFRVKASTNSKRKRDGQVTELRDKYTQKYAKIDEKIRRAQVDVEEHDAQVKDQKYQTAISLGSAILGGFLGRKSIGGATRTVRDLSRGSKKKREVEYAKETMQSLQLEKQRLETQFQSDVNSLEYSTDPITENLENIVITPSKQNISVRFVALVWSQN